MKKVSITRLVSMTNVKFVLPGDVASFVVDEWLTSRFSTEEPDCERYHLASPVEIAKAKTKAELKPDMSNFHDLATRYYRNRLDLDFRLQVSPLDP